MLIKESFYFTDTEAVELFRSAGLEVERGFLPVTYKALGYTEDVEFWLVTNPNNNKKEKLEDYFREYLRNKKKELFLTEENKLKIINLFKK